MWKERAAVMKHIVVMRRCTISICWLKIFAYILDPYWLTWLHVAGQQPDRKVLRSLKKRLRDGDEVFGVEDKVRRK